MELERDKCGEKLVAYYGCFGCHNIAGFENYSPIAPELSGWGKKDITKLLLFESSALETGQMTSLQEYEERCGANQDARRGAGTDRLHRLRGLAHGSGKDPLRLLCSDDAARPLDGKLHPGATLEVDTQVEPAQQNRRKADHDEETGQ